MRIYPSQLGVIDLDMYRAVEKAGVAIEAGDHVLCRHCSESHVVSVSEVPTKSGKERKTATYACEVSGKSYMAGVNGRAVPGLRIVR